MPTPGGLFGSVVVERHPSGAAQPGYDGKGRWQETKPAGSSGPVDDATVAVTVLNNTLYTLTVNGNPYTFTSDADATAAEIAAGLAALADAGETSVTVTEVGGTIRLTKANGETQRFTVDLDANLTFSALTLTILANAQPMSPGLVEVLLDREGERLRGDLLVITNEQLRTVDDSGGIPADVIQWEGDRFEVIRAEPYVQGVIDHREYVARRIKE